MLPSFIGFLEKIADVIGAGEFFRTHKHHVFRMTRVILVGSVGFVIQMSIFEIVGIRLQLVAPSTAALFGAEFAILTNFFLHSRYSFADMMPAAPLLPRLLRFHLVVSGSLLMQWGAVFIAERLTDDLLLIRLAYACGVGIGFLMNYTGYYLFVWRRKQSGDASA